MHKLSAFGFQIYKISIGKTPSMILTWLKVGMLLLVLSDSLENVFIVTKWGSLRAAAPKDLDLLYSLLLIWHEVILIAKSFILSLNPFYITFALTESAVFYSG